MLTAANINIPIYEICNNHVLNIQLMIDNSRKSHIFAYYKLQNIRLCFTEYRIILPCDTRLQACAKLRQPTGDSN